LAGLAELLRPCGWIKRKIGEMEGKEKGIERKETSKRKGKGKERRGREGCPVLWK